MRGIARRRTGAAAALLCLSLSVGVTGCGDDDDISGSLARNSAAQAGKAAFSEAGHDIDGNLVCRDRGSGKDMVVTCAGTTEDGQEAEMTAELGEDAEVTTGDGARFDGFAIVGTVDGETVFEESCIGTGCDSGGGGY